MPALRLILRIAPVRLWSFYRCFSLDTKSRYWYLKNSFNQAGLRLLEIIMLTVIKDEINLPEYREIYNLIGVLGKSNSS